MIKASLRMRPDRIVVGEVRGGEAFDMMQCLNMGHDGLASLRHIERTVHFFNYSLFYVVSNSQSEYPLIILNKHSKILLCMKIQNNGH